MTYPPVPGPDGSQPPPPDSPFQAYEPPQPYAPQPHGPQPHGPQPLASQPPASQPPASEPFPPQSYGPLPPASQPLASEPFAPQPFAPQPFGSQPPYGPSAYSAPDPYAPMNSQAYGYAGPQGPAGYPASPYSYQQFPPPVAPSTDNMAIASLVVSCASVLGLCGFWVGGLLGIVGAILGHVARSRIARTGAGGGGMALAGIIVGWIVAALTVLTMVGLVALIANDSSRTF